MSTISAYLRLLIINKKVLFNVYKKTDVEDVTVVNCIFALFPILQSK